eukprot:CAMPEP_0117435362 /NCGR_PEP_ID=MMETSP0759-20121206/442_1 /TAXON_ID=63605 /ORGANISM="Percolomonas cosmopolitus, Strain WS" /LENGTH=350 /DNA_ID=CAMNT_0005226907 /DNA_START=195 /DNA_END=1247 /DNA_ORIENTATION=-
MHEKRKRTQQFTIVQQWFDRFGRKYLTEDEIASLQLQLDLKSPSETRSLVTAARISGRRRSGISKAHKDLVHSIVDQSDHQDIPHLCDEVQKVDSRISREALHHLIRKRISSIRRRTITTEQKQAIIQHIAHSSHPEDISQLCDELLSQIPLPRDVLYEVIREQLVVVNRRMVTPAHKDIIAQRVEQSLKSGKTVSELCDELQNETNLSRHLVYRLMEQHRSKLLRRHITKEQRALVKLHVQHSVHRGNIPRLCDEIEQILDVPRVVLHHMIRKALISVQRELVTDEQRNAIRTHVESSLHLDRTRLCAELHPRMNLPIDVLRLLIANSIAKVRRKQLSRLRVHDELGAS